MKQPGKRPSRSDWVRFILAEQDPAHDYRTRLDLYASRSCNVRYKVLQVLGR